MRYLFIFISLLALATASLATTIHVPTDQPTIQAGINAAANGDTVLVEPGIYTENIVFWGERITVHGRAGAGSTTISAAQSGQPVVRLVNGEPKGAEISGFTITGSGVSGVQCNGSSPTIINNIITGNASNDSDTGPGIDLNNTSGALIRGNRIHNNAATTYGPAIHIKNGSSNDTIAYNLIYSSSSGYIEIRVLGAAYNLQVYNNTISATHGAGFYSDGGSTVFENNIVFFSDGTAVYGSGITAAYNCTFANVQNYGITPAQGNIYQPALFVDTTNRDYTLSPSSPCINAGDPNPQFNDPDGTRNDMGAFEYMQHIPHTIIVPDSYATIRQAIDSAGSNDTILVSPGIYAGNDNCDIDIYKGPLVIKARDGALSTSIDCGGTSYAYYIQTTSSVIIDGFTILNGYDPISIIRAQSSMVNIMNCRFVNNDALNGVVGAWGAADIIVDRCLFQNNHNGSAINVLGSDAGAIIKNCDFINNVGSTGTGIDIGGDAQISNCRFIGNRGGRGSALICSGHALVDSCLFVGNYSTDAGEYGGGTICTENHGLVEIKSSTAIGNGAANHGGFARCDANTSLLMYECIIAYSSDGEAIYVEDYATAHLECSDIFGNVEGDWIGFIASQADSNGNMNLDPMLCDTAGGNFTIYDGSPCAPANNACSTLIGAFGVGCNGIPSVNVFGVPDETLTNLLVHTPLFSWAYLCPVGNPEDSFEIAVGTNPDWSHAEMWNPEAFAGPDTFITYAGLPLVDGATYYLRLRVHNGLAWSEWYNTSFRMNSIPTVPVHKSPGNNAIVTITTPALYLLNSNDPESDPLFYDYEVINDSEYVVASVAGIAQQPDSSGWTIDITLGENRWYRWRARAFDGYEYSAWTVPTSFYVNSSEEPPSAFTLTFPLGELPVYDKPVELLWGASFDPDPLDSVRYKLMIALDANFTFVATYDNIYQPHYPLGNLDYGTHYWWKVQAFDTKGNMTPGTNTADFWTWLLGDANADRSVNVGDAVFIINFVFKAGTAPTPLKIGDVNADCTVNVGDAVAVINYIFKEGDPPGVGCAE